MFAPSVVGGLGRVACFWAVIQALNLAAWAGYGGGSGTAADPYLIFTAGQLNEIGTHPQDLDKHFRLMADIDLSSYRGSDFHRIGTPDDGPFTGTFDGNYKTLSNFQWSSEWARHVGLFGFLDGEQVRIMNLTLVDPNVATETGQYVGGLAGLLRDGTIVNCHVRRGTISGDNSVGALVGKKEGGVVTGCTACATVPGPAVSAGWSASATGD